MNLFKKAYSATTLLVGVCLLLAWLFARSYSTPVDIVSPTQTMTPSPGTQKPSPIADQLISGLPNRNDFKAVITRPLFNEKRRPPEPLSIDKPLKAAVTPPAVTLSGVIISADERTAVFEDRASSHTVRLHEGDKLGEWRLEHLKSDRVILRYGERTHEIMLRDYKKKLPDSKHLNLRGLPGPNNLSLPPNFRPN